MTLNFTCFFQLLNLGCFNPFKVAFSNQIEKLIWVSATIIKDFFSAFYVARHASIVTVDIWRGS